MSRINYRRKDTWKLRKPVPMKPDKTQIPESIYNRDKEKRRIKAILEGTDETYTE